MSAHNFADLLPHAGHHLECVTYGDNAPGAGDTVTYGRGKVYNVAVECVDCGAVLLDFDRGQ